LLDEELHNFYSSPNIIRMIIKKDEMGRTSSTHVEKRIAYRILVGKSEGKRTLGRPRRRWEDNITMNVKEIEWGGINWIHLAQGKDWWRVLVNAVMNLRVPQNVGKFLSDSDWRLLKKDSATWS
jgi:hypothetical protein